MALAPTRLPKAPQPFLETQPHRRVHIAQHMADLLRRSRKATRPAGSPGGHFSHLFGHPSRTTPHGIGDASPLPPCAIAIQCIGRCWYRLRGRPSGHETGFCASPLALCAVANQSSLSLIDDILRDRALSLICRHKTDQVTINSGQLAQKNAARPCVDDICARQLYLSKRVERILPALHERLKLCKTIRWEGTGWCLHSTLVTRGGTTSKSNPAEKARRDKDQRQHMCWLFPHLIAPTQIRRPLRRNSQMEASTCSRLSPLSALFQAA